MNVSRNPLVLPFEGSLEANVSKCFTHTLVLPLSEGSLEANFGECFKQSIGLAVVFKQSIGFGVVWG